MKAKEFFVGLGVTTEGGVGEPATVAVAIAICTTSAITIAVTVVVAIAVTIAILIAKEISRGGTHCTESTAQLPLLVGLKGGNLQP